MRFLIPPQTIAEHRHQKFPAFEVFGVTAAALGASAATSLAIAGTTVAVAGSAYSAYSQSQAQAANARLGRMNAQAQAQIAAFQADTNYKVAMAQSQMHTNNSIVLHNYARSQEVQGNEQINRSYQQEEAATSGVRANYGASGITEDSGSPLMVEAHNAGAAQLARMDQAYITNMKALDTDWQGTMEKYQADLGAEVAKQYQYGMDVAAWQGGAAANYAYAQQMQQSDNTAISGYLQSFGTLLNGAGGFLKPSTTGGIGTGLGSGARAGSFWDRTFNGSS